MTQHFSMTEMKRTTSSAARELGVFASASIVGAVLLALVGAWPTYRLAGQAGITAMVVGISVSAFASLVAALPLVLSRETTPSSRQVALMGAMAARMFTTLILFVVVVFCHVVSNKPFAIWTATSYLVLLAIETFLAVTLTKRREALSR